MPLDAALGAALTLELETNFELLALDEEEP